MKENSISELYQRVEHVAKILTGSVPQLAKELGREYRTFKGYLSEKRQDNLWPILPELLDSFPRLSRQWLYFGEGPMLIGHGVPLDRPVPLKAIAEAVEAMAKDAGGTNAALLHYMTGMPFGDMNDSDIFESHLKKRYAEALEELNALKTKVIDLQEELLHMHRGRRQERRAYGVVPANALGSGNAAPLSLHGSDD